MNLPIDKISISTDGWVYVYLRPPKIEGTKCVIRQVSLKYTPESVSRLLGIQKKEHDPENEDN